MNYPNELTTSDWVDWMQGRSRDEQIAAIATLHRRLAHAEHLRALDAAAHPESLEASGVPAEYHGLVRQHLADHAGRLSPPGDYAPSDQAPKGEA